MRGYDGKPRMYQMTGPTGAQAEAALLAKLNDMLPPTDDVISPDMVISELAKFWWLEFEDLGRAANTRRRYREIIDTYILPGVGNLTIREANDSTLDKFLKGVRTKHGNATAKMSKTLLSGMMSLATRHGAAPANPLREVARIPTGTKEVRALTIDEVAKLRHDVYRWQQPTGRQNGLHEKDILDVVDIMLATGARIGEALAIRWSDVDLAAEKPTVTIQGTIIDVRGKNGLRIQDHPKSANSRQRYFLPLFAVEMLRRRQADPVRQNALDLVFPSSTLTIRDPNGFRKQWREARKAAGFDWVTPHTFRKSVGTILANTQGMAAATAQLGHSSELITRKHYVQKTHEAPDNTEVLQAFGQTRQQSHPGHP
ncbi:tyrosine-type recombinase/integrase [Arthrobacter silviterrae]|uniref:Site-specific integrase n=2 Tax=Arthrobacter silviterrae TaxID=2026658 RepID=A0ABX0DD39_9MICC|nr:site-specific integrase [Arthrobacter silviterrae]NGN84814.1 site-specific integrase [Arthrobacter silviterrae]